MTTTVRFAAITIFLSLAAASCVMDDELDEQYIRTAARPSQLAALCADDPGAVHIALIKSWEPYQVWISGVDVGQFGPTAATVEEWSGGGLRFSGRFGLYQLPGVYLDVSSRGTAVLSAGDFEVGMRCEFMADALPSDGGSDAVQEQRD